MARPPKRMLAWALLGLLLAPTLAGGGFEYYKGYYNAQGRLVSGQWTYTENKYIGPSTAVGTQHTFHIQRDGWQSWGVYVDYQRASTFTADNTGYDMDVGIESSDAATTSAAWYEKNFQLYRSGSWKYWTTGALEKTDSPAPYYGLGVQWVTRPVPDGSVAPKIKTWDN